MFITVYLLSSQMKLINYHKTSQSTMGWEGDHIIKTWRPIKFTIFFTRSYLCSSAENLLNLYAMSNVESTHAKLPSLFLGSSSGRYIGSHCQILKSMITITPTYPEYDSGKSNSANDFHMRGRKQVPLECHKKNICIANIV
jgi:hypothetical protein